jgi:anti-sigma-K factor RskA
VPAAVAAATSMESTATMEPAASTAMEASAAMEAAISATESAAIKGTVREAIAPSETAPVVPPSIIAAPVETRTPVKAMKPRAGAYEDATRKVVWSVVTVWRASIRVIAVVAVGARRSRTIVGRANSNADNHSLRLRRNCSEKHANCQ